MVTAVLTALILCFIWARGESLLPVGIMLVVTMLFMLLMGVRIAMALGVIAMLGLFILLPSPQLSLMAERAWNSLNSFTLTAVPMFVLMGGLLLRAGVTTELFDALLRWMGRLPGGIAHASVGACGVFAAVSGSSLATAATMGTVACPEMIKRGYSARLTYGVVAAGGTLGILIPPSIAMIIYGTTVGAPITVLFIAGIIPGIILMLSMMAVVYAWAVLIKGSAPRGESYTWPEKFKSLVGVLPFLILIIAVLGSLYAGVATPTEAGAIGAVVALAMCIQRGKFSWSMLYETSLETVKVTSMLLFIVVGASILSWVFDYLRLPRSMVTFVEAAELSPVLVMAIIGLIYIVLGMFIDPISMMLMTLPVTFPIVIAMGFDPIWFGIALVMMIEVGLITPPVGIILFVLRGISGDVPLKEIVYGVLPFVGVILANVVLIYYFPEIVSWLPDQMEQ
jgi:tripartite ATP-independent transporter DctM subunit